MHMCGVGGPMDGVGVDYQHKDECVGDGLVRPKYLSLLLLLLLLLRHFVRMHEYAYICICRCRKRPVSPHTRTASSSDVVLIFGARDQGVEGADAGVFRGGVCC